MSSWNRFRNNVKSTVSCGRVFSTVLALVLIFTMVLSGAILVACNPKGNGDAAEKERAAACDALRANALAAVNDAWTDGLSDEQIVLLPDAGKYVLAVFGESKVCITPYGALESVKTGNMTAFYLPMSLATGRKLSKRVKYVEEE